MAKDSILRLDEPAGVREQSADILEEVALRTQAESAEVDDMSWLAELTSDALPRLPQRPGIHFCWLTTTNPSDPIHRRLRIGYRLCRASDFPELDTYAVRAEGQDYSGHIMCNEMIMAEIPEDRYQRMMHEFHYRMPLQEEAGLRAQTEAFIQDHRDSKGRPLVTLESGIQELGHVPAPTRFE
jgi:hypothetical protein